MPTQASAGPSGCHAVDLGVRRPVEEAAQGETGAREDLDDTMSVGHSTAPPPYSQIGEREA